MATPYIVLEITSSISKTNSRGRPSNSHKHVLLELYDTELGLNIILCILARIWRTRHYSLCNNNTEMKNSNDEKIIEIIIDNELKFKS